MKTNAVAIESATPATEPKPTAYNIPNAEPKPTAYNIPNAESTASAASTPSSATTSAAAAQPIIPKKITYTVTGGPGLKVLRNHLGEAYDSDGHPQFTLQFRVRCDLDKKESICRTVINKFGYDPGRPAGMLHLEGHIMVCTPYDDCQKCHRFVGHYRPSDGSGCFRIIAKTTDCATIRLPIVKKKTN